MERNSTGPYRHLLLGLMLMVTSVPTPAVAQHPVEVETLSPLLPGITLPVQLEHSLHPGKSVVGTPVIARTTQRVPVSPNRYLKRGAELVGEVTASAASGNNLAKLETLSVRFTTLRYRGQTVPINADVLAIANFTDVGDTFAPATGSTDRGNPSAANWTTRQVGGDEVYRAGWSGDVYNTVMRKVGVADYDGVYRLASEAGPGFPLAVGVFSTAAQGLYGFNPETILTSTRGQATLTSLRQNLSLHAGDNLLLQVVDAR